MAYIYGTYRPKVIGGSYNLERNTSLNGVYSLSFFLDGQFADYKKAGLTKILDHEIPENRYTGEIVPGVKKQTRFVMAYYNEKYIDPEEFKKSVEQVGAEFKADMFDTPLDACKWIEANTNLKKVEDIKDDNGNIIGAKYEIYPERTDEITGKTIPAKYLEIK